MKITCIRCGAERFKTGELQPAVQGGFFVVMPCAECETANVVLYEPDAEIAQTLLDFFATPPAVSHD